MNTDVIVTKHETHWRFEPQTEKANSWFNGETWKVHDLAEAQKTLFWCSEKGLLVQAPVFTSYYQLPTLREVRKTRPKGPRHPITRHRI